jgi:hypothetical protein
MANISNIVNVALLPEGALAARDNMNVCAVMTAQQDGPLSTANRYALYSDVGSVATDFGTASDMYAHAVAFFGTTPNPINAGGLFVAGYWRGAEETVAATAAVLTGAQLVEATVIPQLQQISDGALAIDVDDANMVVSGLDLRGVTTLEEVAVLLDAELIATETTATASVNEYGQIIITSDTTGATSLISLVYDDDPLAVGGTYIGTLLGLSTGTGAVAVQGADADVLTAETQVQAVTELKALINVKGIVFIDAAVDADRKLLAAWAQANDTLIYDVFSGAAYLTTDADTNAVWYIKLAGQTNYRMLYSAANNRLFATSYMARVHVVNFNAENSALTMHLKTLAVAAESYTQAEITAAKKVGLDIYTTTKLTPEVLTSGANDFVDNRYNLIGFVDAVQTDMYNLLKGTATKIPQTQRGVNQLIDQGEKTTRGFVRAGIFAPGTWSSPDYFGDRETFERSIEQNGFYWLAGSLADQPQSDRQARKSPVLQAAVKNAGAIHSVDIIINFNF